MPPKQPSQQLSEVIDITERVVWTFVQGFMGAVPFTIALDKNHVEGALLAGAAGGVAALISFGKNLSVKKVQQNAQG